MKKDKKARKKYWEKVQRKRKKEEEESEMRIQAERSRKLREANSRA